MITDLCARSRLTRYKNGNVSDCSLARSPEDDDVLEEGEEDEDDARAHPDVEGRDVADARRTLPATNGV